MSGLLEPSLSRGLVGSSVTRGRWHLHRGPQVLLALPLLAEPGDPGSALCEAAGLPLESEDWT